METRGFLDPITQSVLAIVFSYLVGSIPIGLIVARMVAGIDIREHGSGNIGLTNVIRTLGWGPGLITGVLDFIKGYIPVFLTVKFFTPEDFGGVTTVYETIIILVAFTLILGNLFPVYVLFRGGKGVMTYLGIMSALLGVYIFIPITIFVLIIFIFRMVSLASIVSVACTPFTIIALRNNLAFTSGDSSSAYSLLLFYSLIAAALVIWRHKSNIKRIIDGTESRVGRSKDKTVESMSERLNQQTEKYLKATETDKPESSEDSNNTDPDNSNN